MKLNIKKYNLIRFRNNEHFQLNTEIRDLLLASKVYDLPIRTQFEVYEKLLKSEDEAIKKIVKSSFTEEIHDIDKRRDTTFFGMIATNRAAYRHFNAEVVAAAKRLQIVFNTYGNIAKLPLNEGISAINNMLQELNGTYSKDIDKVGLRDWLKELESNNGILGDLVKSRYEERAIKTDINMQEVRTEVDNALRDIVDRIDALYLLEGLSIYETLIKKINVIAEKYNNIVAQRYGRLAAKKQKNNE